MSETRSLPRREFLGRLSDFGKAGVLGLVASQLPALDANAGFSASELDDLTRFVFASQLGTTFLVHTGSPPPIEAELVELSVLGPTTDENGATLERIPFSLLFRVDENLFFPQDTYLLEHAELGVFNLFVVPVGPDKGFYEAVFNYNPLTQTVSTGNDSDPTIISLPISCGAGVGMMLPAGLIALVMARFASVADGPSATESPKSNS